MAINRNFLVKQGIQVGLTANAGSTWTSNDFISNKNDVLAVPSLTLDFTKGFIDPRVQNLRASSATYLDQNGFIQVVGNNTPRVEYDIDTGVCRGLVSEEERTNIFWYSDIEGSVGSPVRGMDYALTNPSPTVSSDFWIGPNKMSAKHTRGVQGDNNVGYFYNQQTMTGNSWYTFSMYVYIPSTSNLNDLYAYVETGATSVVNPGARANLSIRDKWQRIVNPYVANTSIVLGGMGWVLRIDPPGAVVYTDCWQMEQGEYASTWIPTTNVTTATRASEFHYVYPFTTYHNPSNFSLFVEATPKWTSNSTLQNYTNQYGFQGSNRHIVGLDYFFGPTNIHGGSPYNGYAIQYPSAALSSGALTWGSREYGNTTPGAATSGTARGVGLTNTGYSYNTFVANTSTKVAATTNSSAGTIMSNGSISTYANNTMTGSNPYSNNIFTDRLLVGWAIQGGVPSTIFGGNIKKVSYFPRSLSLNELTAITET